MISEQTIRNKKLRIISQIDMILNLLDKPDSGYDYIVDSMSLNQLQAINAELKDELWYIENYRPIKVNLTNRLK